MKQTFLFIAIACLVSCKKEIKTETLLSESSKVNSPNYVLTSSCNPCAVKTTLDPTIFIYGSGFNSGKEIYCLATRDIGGLGFEFHAATVDADGNFSFGYLYNNLPGTYTLSIYQYQNWRQKTLTGTLTIVVQ